MKKRKLLGVVALSLTLGLTSCSEPSSSTPITTTEEKADLYVNIQSSTLSVVAGEMLALNADSTNGATLSWASSKTEVATVDTNGVVTAVAAGVTSITVTASLDGETATDTVSVVVTDPTATVLTVTLGNVPTLIVGESFTATAVTSIPGATLTWASTNEAVATVDNGVITAVGAGAGSITVTAVAGGQSATAVTSFRVESAPVEEVVELEVSIPSLPTLEAGEQYAINPTANKAGATFAYTSLNTAIATVDANGVITAVAAGVAEIEVTATLGDETATSRVTLVVRNSSSVRIEAAFTGNKVVFADDPDLNYTRVEGRVVKGDGQNDYSQRLVYTTEDTDLIELDENTGHIIGVWQGQANVKITSTDNPEVSTWIVVTIRFRNQNAADWIHFNTEDAHLYVGDKLSVNDRITFDEDNDGLTGFTADHIALLKERLTWTLEGNDGYLEETANGEYTAVKATPATPLPAARTDIADLVATVTIHVYDEIGGYFFRTGDEDLTQIEGVALNIKDSSGTITAGTTDVSINLLNGHPTDTAAAVDYVTFVDTTTYAEGQTPLFTIANANGTKDAAGYATTQLTAARTGTGTLTAFLDFDGDGKLSEEAYDKPVTLPSGHVVTSDVILDDISVQVDTIAFEATQIVALGDNIQYALDEANVVDITTNQSFGLIFDWNYEYDDAEAYINNVASNYDIALATGHEDDGVVTIGEPAPSGYVNIYALKAGTTELLVTYAPKTADGKEDTNNPYYGLTTTVEVNVVATRTISVPAAQNGKTLSAGETFKLTPTMTGTSLLSAEEKALTYTVAKESEGIVSVDGTGLVTALAEGTATITVTGTSAAAATPATVTVNVEDLSIFSQDGTERLSRDITLTEGKSLSFLVKDITGKNVKVTAAGDNESVLEKVTFAQDPETLVCTLNAVAAFSQNPHTVTLTLVVEEEGTDTQADATPSTITLTITVNAAAGVAGE